MDFTNYYAKSVYALGNANNSGLIGNYMNNKWLIIYNIYTIRHSFF